MTFVFEAMNASAKTSATKEEMGTTQKGIWWEKTVEYQFVIQSLNECQLNLAMPLSGVEERVADCVFGAGWKIVLVEFKRTQGQLNSEHAKFDDYAVAEAALKAEDAHHFLVYGGRSPQAGPPALQLAARTYFSRATTVNLKSVFAAGISEKALKTYITKLASFKKEDGRSTGTIGPDSLSSVVGVSSNGESCRALTFSNYCAKVLPELLPELASTPAPRRRKLGGSTI